MIARFLGELGQLERLLKIGVLIIALRGDEWLLDRHSPIDASPLVCLSCGEAAPCREYMKVADLCQEVRSQVSGLQTEAAHFRLLRKKVG